LFVWWFSTGAVLYVIGLPPRTFRWSMAVATSVALLSLYGLWSSNSELTPSSAYAAFTFALLVWGWHEMSFLTGIVTGPRTTECPERQGDRAKLWPAVETVLYHEVAILLTALAIYSLVADGPNKTGLWTFVILWVMRLSAKFNVYLGVPNLTEEFLPAHLKYLKSYFCHRSMNLLFPLAITLSTVVTAMLVSAATAPGASDFEITRDTFLATLMGLAVLEHWFLVVPIPSASLWTWGLASRDDYQQLHKLKDQRSKRDQRDAGDTVSATA
jgi:putative photosynthetic complex assembly protein 2